MDDESGFDAFAEFEGLGGGDLGGEQMPDMMTPAMASAAAAEAVAVKREVDAAYTDAEDTPYLPPTLARVPADLRPTVACGQCQNALWHALKMPDKKDRFRLRCWCQLMNQVTYDTASVGILPIIFCDGRMKAKESGLDALN